MIATIKDNSITYPTDFYRKYSLYLIEELTWYMNNVKEASKQKVSDIIINIQELIDDNDYANKNKTDVFSVMDWEERLVFYYDSLEIASKYHNGCRKISSIENFLRKEKLKKLNNTNHIKSLKRKLLKNKKLYENI
jgi:hypothetical protein